MSLFTMGLPSGDAPATTADPPSIFDRLTPLGENGALQQNRGSQSSTSCQALQAPPVNIPSDDPNSVVARRRRDQRRFRTKEKERSQATRCLLADTQKRLQQTEEQRNALQARNQVLESFVFAKTASGAAPSNGLRHIAREYTAAVQPDACASQLTSADGSKFFMTPVDISQLPTPGFANLYTVAVQHLKHVLVDLHGPSSKAASNQLTVSTNEATSLVLSLVMGSPARLPQFSRLSMADGSINAEQGPDNASQVLERIGLTEGQIQDLLVLRSLFFSRVGQLTSERIKLMQQMAENSQHLAKVEAWAEQLRQNILEEHHMYLSNLTAIYLGIHTTKQAAVAMAAAYPSLLSQTMLEQAAIDRGYPPLSDIINQKAPPLEILNWNHVNMYVRMINVHNMFTYVPFLPSVRTRLLCPSLTPP